MPEVLHAWALAPAAVGTCCLIAERRKTRASEIVASALMLLAMMDTAQPSHQIAPVFWAALLIAAAMLIAGLRRVRSRGDSARIENPRADSSLHATLGLVLMAALLLGMPGHGATGDHAHAGVGPAVLIFGAAVYIASSLVSAVRTPLWRDRAQFASMALSTLLMTLAMIK